MLSFTDGWPRFKAPFLTILRAGPDDSTEGAKPHPQTHQHHPADTLLVK